VAGPDADLRQLLEVVAVAPDDERPALLIVRDVDGERESIAFDTGQCARTMMLAAWEIDIGSCHASVYDQQLTRLPALPVQQLRHRTAGGDGVGWVSVAGSATLQLLRSPDGMCRDLVISVGSGCD
jgi:hypothetical protein